MDQLQMIFTFKTLIVGLALLAGSIMDIRTRRIHDEIWMIMLAACIPLLGWEMWLKGASDSPITMLSLLLPIGGMVFVLFGYPEPRKALNGSAMDIFFMIVYTACIAGPVIAFINGDRGLFIPIGVTFVFMIVYFILYQVPIGGTRIIHGGADAKCLMALAAIFPWYIHGLTYSIGPFYEIIEEFSAFGWVFPIHLSVLFNGAVITAVVLFLILPVMNILRKDLSFPRMFTSYRKEVDGIAGKHVWIFLEYKVKKKVEPTEMVERRLKELGQDKVWVTPKIPFILSLFIGFLAQITIGNIVAILFLQI